MKEEETLMDKSFQLLNQQTGKLHTYNVRIQYLPATREINISRAISYICSLGLQLNNCQIFYQDFSRKVYSFLGTFPFKQEIYLKYELFLDSPIKIRFKSMGGPPNPNQKYPGCNKNDISMQKKKVKQRSIRQASEYVTQWRNLYQEIDNNGKRLYTLQTAANQVGLAKKTLDDYFYQLRQAEHYGFDFQNHLCDKIGVLRRFVRQCIKNQLIECQAVTPQDDIDKYLASNSSDSDEDRRYH